MPRLHTYAIALTCALLMLPGCKGEKHDPAPRDKALAATQVKIAPVRLNAAGAQIEVLGTVTPTDRAVIAAKVTGTIARMPVGLGSSVKAGQLLVEIHADEIAAKLSQARTQLEQAKRNLDRESRLLAKNASTPETVKTMEEAHRMAEDGYREAKTLAGYANITAPFAGQITAKSANAGDLATPGLPLLVLENNRRLQIVTDVPESLMVNIHPGDRLPVHIQAADLDATGVVAEVAPAADPASRTAQMKIDLAPSPKLRSGQFARIALAGDGAQTLFIPAAAVLPFGQMDRVFVARDNKAELRLVRIGQRRGEMVEILSGLNPDEQVVITNNSHLADGQPLDIKP